MLKKAIVIFNMPGKSKGKSFFIAGCSSFLKNPTRKRSKRKKANISLVNIPKKRSISG